MPIEHWKDGTVRDVTRDAKGHFVTWKIVTFPPKPPFFPPLPPEEEIIYYRASVGLNFSEQNRYFGALVQEWFHSESDAYNALARLEREVIDITERHLAYTQDEWWFIAKIGKGVQEVADWRYPYKVIEENLDAFREAEA